VILFDFNVPLGKKVFINGIINTNGGSITFNNDAAVHFQNTGASAIQTLNTAGGAMNFGASSIIP
jgi:hypothetical protein